MKAVDPLGVRLLALLDVTHEVLTECREYGAAQALESSLQVKPAAFLFGRCDGVPRRVVGFDPGGVGLELGAEIALLGLFLSHQLRVAKSLVFTAQRLKRVLQSEDLFGRLPRGLAAARGIRAQRVG